MAKWKVEQLKLDKKIGIWSAHGVWEVEAPTSKDALRYVFINYLEMSDDCEQFISQSSAALYGLSLTVGDKCWSVKPAGAGVPG